jgi:hypothetical protein
VTDAHCHPTDLFPARADYDEVALGGLAAMATADDQDEVGQLGIARPWVAEEDDVGEGSSRGLRVVSSFGAYRNTTRH